VSAGVKADMNTLFRQLLHAKGETDFAETQNEIKDACEPFHQYLTDNWYPLKECWVHYQKNRETNLGNTTTNRIEVQFGKLKQIMKSKVSLSVCLKQLLQFVKSVQMQSSFDKFSVQTKVTYNSLADTDVGQYFGLCTRYACDKILKSLDKSKASNIIVAKTDGIASEHSVTNTATNAVYTVTDCSQCTCMYFSSALLPCKHVFAVRTFECLSVYDPSLIARHWLLSYQLSFAQCDNVQRVSLQPAGCSKNVCQHVKNTMLHRN